MTVEVYRDASETHWRFRPIAANGEVFADNYDSAADAARGWADLAAAVRLADAAGGAEVVVIDGDPPERRKRPRAKG